MVLPQIVTGLLLKVSKPTNRINDLLTTEEANSLSFSSFLRHYLSVDGFYDLVERGVDEQMVSSPEPSAPGSQEESVSGI